MHTIRTLLVDDSLEFLEATRAFLAFEPTIDVVGCVSQGLQVLDEVRKLKPDLVLLDLAMSDLNGIEVLRRIKTMAESPRVVILTLFDSPEYENQSMRMGAAGFVSKANLGVQLMPTIHALFAGPLHQPETR